MNLELWKLMSASTWNFWTSSKVRISLMLLMIVFCIIALFLLDANKASGYGFVAGSVAIITLLFTAIMSISYNDFSSKFNESGKTSTSYVTVIKHPVKQYVVFSDFNQQKIAVKTADDVRGAGRVVLQLKSGEKVRLNRNNAHTRFIWRTVINNKSVNKPVRLVYETWEPKAHWQQYNGSHKVKVLVIEQLETMQQNS